MHQHHIRNLNESGTLDEDVTIGSADVKALHPNIDFDFAADICLVRCFKKVE